MQNIIIGNTLLGNTLVITPIINSITSLSSSIYHLIGHFNITKNTHHTEVLKMLNRTDIAATILLLQPILLDISSLPPSSYFNNKFMPIALNNVKEIISTIERELQVIKEKISYNTSIYVMASMRSYDLFANIETIENNSIILNRRCDYLFKSLDLCKHFANTETPSMKSGDAVLFNAV
jgi:hypothetical protein